MNVIAMSKECTNTQHSTNQKKSYNSETLKKPFKYSVAL